MRIKIFLKKLVSIGVAAILAVTLAGCFDLGSFNDETEYYAAFGDVKLVYQNPNAIEKDIKNEEYSVKDYFYNKNTGNNFTYGDPKDEDPDDGKDIPQLSYVYMAIPVETDLNIDSVALYLNAQQTCSLEIVFYVVDDLPNGGNFTNIRLLGEPEYQQKLDEDGNPMTDGNGLPIYGEEKIEYSDPDDSLIVAKTTLQLKDGKWDPLIVENWDKGNTLEIKEGQFLLLRFINNSGANTTGNLSVAFRVTNLLIRALS
jgi:hypothetical protein